MRTDCRDSRWHLLYVDILLAKGEMGTLPDVAAGVLCGILDVTGYCLVRRLWFRLCGGFTLNHRMLLPHGNPYCCCYGTSAPGEDKAAGAHLCQVFGQEPRDAVAQARVGVVEALQQNYRSAVRRLSKLTEKDSSSLDFLLSLIPFNQRKTMAQVSPYARILDSLWNEQSCLCWRFLHFFILLLFIYLL